jgi:acetoacetate decarboxylase
MQNGSFFIQRQQLRPFFNPGEMNSEEGLYLCWVTDPAAARRVLPPPLELAIPEQPVVMVYVVNIREPTFAPWYMEAALMLLARYRDKSGVYMVNLQLSGPGAEMGQCSGREFSGLPKKCCEKIVVERTGDTARALIERKGRRILDAEIAIGAYNDPLGAQFYGDAGAGRQARGSCFLFRCEPDVAADGHMIFPRMALLNYDSLTEYRSWEPAAISSIAMQPSLDDPWAELAVVKPLGAGYSVNSNRDVRSSVLAQFAGEEADNLFSYLFSGRWDRSTLSGRDQRYGQF